LYEQNIQEEKACLENVLNGFTPSDLQTMWDLTRINEIKKEKEKKISNKGSSESGMRGHGLDQSGSG
jgi:hypothetical protein